MSKPCRDGRCIGYAGGSNKQYRIVRKDGRIQYLHRLVYAHINGPIPSGKVIRHTCDTPWCYEPEHLILGTQADNMQDKVLRGRHPRGSNSVLANLTNEQVAYIKCSLRKPYRGLQVKLANMFNVSKQTITDIKKGKRYGI